MIQFCIICREEKECKIIGEELHFGGFILHPFFQWCTPWEEKCRRKHENTNVIASGGFGSPSDVVVADGCSCSTDTTTTTNIKHGIQSQTKGY